MDDKQPRLNTSSKFSLDTDDDDDHNENYKSFSFDKYDLTTDKLQKTQNDIIIFHRFSDGSRRYSGKKMNDKYRKLDDTSEHNDKAEVISVFRIVSVFKRNIF